MPSRLSRSWWFTQLRGVLFANRVAGTHIAVADAMAMGPSVEPLSSKEPRVLPPPSLSPEFVLVAKRIERKRGTVQRERGGKWARREVTYVAIKVMSPSAVRFAFLFVSTSIYLKTEPLPSKQLQRFAFNINWNNWGNCFARQPLRSTIVSRSTFHFGSNSDFQAEFDTLHVF